LPPPLKDGIGQLTHELVYQKDAGLSAMTVTTRLIQMARGCQDDDDPCHVFVCLYGVISGAPRADTTTRRTEEVKNHCEDQATVLKSFV